jgi:glycosyltransferase involved in cell wall biosynthesis
MEHGGVWRAAQVSQEAAAVRSEPFVSIVVPVFDEQEVLTILVSRLRTVLDGLVAGGEVWFINDGSTDRTGDLLLQAHTDDPRLKVLELSRNFGHPAAITAGLDNARGEVVVLMDADLQDPPEIIPDMIGLYRQGFDVVHAQRSSRSGESIFKRASSWLFYRLLRASSSGTIPVDVGEFRLMSQEVVQALRSLRERHRLVRGLVSWVGFTQTTLPFERPRRAGGTTKYSLTRMVRLAFDAMTSFSVLPLKLATLLGFFAFLLGCIYAGYAVYVGYVLRLGVPGWTSLVILNIFFSGVVLVCLGLIGEYVGRIFEEVKGRPLYLVRRRLGGGGSDGEGRSEGSP